MIKMTNKQLQSLNQHYAQISYDAFLVSYSEALFLPALDALEFYYKKVSELKYPEENKLEFDYVKKMVKENIDLGMSLLELPSNNKNRKTKTRDFFNRYGEILIYVEEIADWNH